MDFFRLENAPGVFLPNGQAAGTSGGPVTGHLSLVTGRRKEPAAGGFFFYGKQLILYDFRPALTKTSDRPLRAFQMTDISLLAMSRTDLHLIRTKLTSDVSRPLGRNRKIIRCTTYKAIGPADQSRQDLLLTCIYSVLLQTKA